MSVPERVHERIRRLLALADSPNEHESAVAMQKARQLLAEHGMTVEQVSSPGAPDPVARVGRDGIEVARVKWESWLSGVLCDHFGTYGVREQVRRGGQWVTILQVYGPPAAVEATIYAYRNVREQLIRLSRVAWKNEPDKHIYRAETWKNAHRAGAVVRLQKRLAAERAQEAAQTTAIILASRALAQEAARRDYPKTQKARTRHTDDHYIGAQRQGYRDGEQVSIQPALTGGKPKRKLAG